VDLIIEPLSFLWNITITFYYTRVWPQCDYSILGRVVTVCLFSLGHGSVDRMLVDNFSHESDVTSLQDPFTSRSYQTPSCFYYCVPRKIRNNECAASSFPDLLASCRAVVAMRLQVRLSLVVCLWGLGCAWQSRHCREKDTLSQQCRYGVGGYSQ